MLNKSLQNDQITRRIDVNSEIQPRAVLHEQLQIIQGSQLDSQAGVDKTVGIYGALVLNYQPMPK
ncbi:hypothetical protein LHK12_03600 [Providencia rettgeri]|nr:hypothetical protein [Providencia rettgeri]